MQPMSRTLLAAFISAAFYSIPSAFADSEPASDKSVAPEMPPIGQCIAPTQTSQEQQQLPVYIEADSAQAFGQNQATYSGDVIVTQGNKNLKADTITVNQSQDNVTARGKVYYNDGQIQSISNLTVSDLKGDRTELTGTKYQLLCQPGRGEAAYILKDGQSIYRMEDGTLTSCPLGNKSWRVKSSSIDIDNNEEEATLKHTRFEILDVPVFYWPYVTVPIGDTRKTGFLYPNFKYGSDDGYEVNVPIYFNLAPNYDLTTTVNVYQHRGLQLENEFRYLTKNFGSGSIQFDYLPSDRDYDDEDRWGFNFNHDGIYDSNWAFEVDYSKVSDIDYFDDLSSNIGEREDNQLLQTGEISYRTVNSETTLLARDFQVLNENIEPYRLLPQLRNKYYFMGAFDTPFDFEMDSHISRFETDDDDRPDATRIHVEPGVILPFNAPWGSLTSEAKVAYTHYDQDLKDINDPDYEKTVNRVVPEVRIDGKLNIDRETKWLGDYTQTLEPRVQYLYVKDEDQRDIFGGYDSTLLQADYYGLFRDRKYSSVDYIAPANQFTYGATSRFYDSNYKERFNISLGQIIYIDENTSKYRDDDENDETRSDFSAVALSTEFNYDDAWYFDGELQYDVDLSEMQIANTSIEYRKPFGYVQLNYRYVTKDYIQANAPDISDTQLNNYTEDGISQFGFLTQAKINDNWSTEIQYFHDTKENIMLEGLAGITYTDDCWSFGITYTRHIEDKKVDTDHFGDNYEQSWGVNVGLRGFGTNAMIEHDSNDNALGYTRPFSLNN